jgi:6-pyruvoyltetrahydropterin/6-carboxytetrahydropterin synthase
VSGDKLQCNGAKTGMVADFGDIKRYMEPILDQYLDHHYLNQTLGIENPTSENVARWIYERLFESGLNGLECVEVQETCTCKCLYKPIFP